VRALVIRTGAMGDTILSFCAARALGRCGYAVALMLPQRRRELAELFGFECLAQEECDFDSLYAAPSGAIARALAPFDLIVAIVSAGDGTLAQNLRGAARGRVVLVDPLPPAHYRAAYPAFLIGAIAQKTGLPLPPGPSLRPPKTRWAPGGDSIVIHPGSGSASKNWPVERYASVVGEFGGRAVFLTGPVEEDNGMARDIEEIRGAARLVRNPPLARLAGLLAGCGAYLGMDSGVTHLAATLGAPTVALFGPTDPAMWGPVGERALALRPENGDMRGISPKEALAALTFLLREHRTTAAWG